MSGLRYVLFLLLLTFGSSLYANTKSPIPIEKTPGWVIKKEPDVPKHIPVNELHSGVYYLLVDNQIKADAKKQSASYSHFAELVVNQEGLDEVSQINIGYAPSYQKIILNSLVIRRGSKIIDKTKTAKITILRRESGLEEQMYDGRLTANIIIDDVRVGDIVEYSYTRVGSNPIFKGLFNYDRYIQWNVPIHYQGVRVLWGKPGALYVKVLNTDAHVTEKKTGRYTIYSLALHDLPARHVNSQTPYWYQPYGVVYFHEARSWSDIASWAASLYDNLFDGGEKIRHITEQIGEKAHTPEARVAAALEYVQSTIRYLGIEMGTSSHKPSPAKETFERRYGDCKDKAVLLISMLKAMGIKAKPALVNTDLGRSIADIPPMMTVFDHVIVKVVLGGKTYWLDPTRTHQFGTLSNIYQPDYGYALVVDRNTRALEPMKNGGHFCKTVITDRFDLSKGPGKDVTFESDTAYYGYAAEKQRYDLASKGVAKLQKQYLDFFSGYYPDIKALMQFQTNDDRQSGVLTQHEKYRIKNFWEKNDKDREYDAEFYINSFNYDLSKPDQIKRNSPFALDFPTEVEHTVYVKLDNDNWSFPDENTTVDNKYFSVTAVSGFDKKTRTLTLHYTYRAKTDFVPAEDIDTYIKQSDKAVDLLDYGIRKPFKTQPADGPWEGVSLGGLAALMIAQLYLAGLVFIIINWRLDAKKEPPFPDAGYYPVSPVKLLVLSVMTANIYACYWFYRNFLYKKRKEGTAIMPVARAIFCTFWYYPLYMSLAEDSAERYGANRVLFKPLAILFAVAFIASAVVSNMDGIPSIAAMIVYPLLLLPLANYINHINSRNPDAYAYHSRWKVRHTLLVILTLPLLLVGAAEEAHFLPSDNVVKGETLRSYDLHFMQRHGIFPPEEKPIYFYSDAFFTVRDDGNGFTAHSVFSYWKENGKLIIEKAQFTDIGKINVTYAEETGNNTIIKIVRKDGSSFILYAAPGDGLDKRFVTQLRLKWEAAKARNDH